MARRPIIGIAMQTQETVPGGHSPAWNVGQKYIHILTSCGAAPWLIPLLPSKEPALRDIFERLDGVFLMGGDDVDPAQYGEGRLSCCQETDPPRDWTETRLVNWAVAEGKPVFGICRGHQMINVALGGTLYQDLREQRPASIRHDYFSTGTSFRRDYLAHPIRVEAGSRLRQLLEGETLDVNSMHHQAIRELAPGLSATAFAPDGLIEGFEGSNGQFLLGVQWHPEELAESSAAMKRLFTAFLDACRS